MAHIGCTAPLCRDPCARPRRARAWPWFWPCAWRAGERYDADVRRGCQSLLSGHSRALYKWRDGDGHQSSGQPGGGNLKAFRCAALTHTPTSSDASLPAPPVRPGTRRPLLRLLHPELPPGREESAAGGWKQTGLEHHPYILL